MTALPVGSLWGLPRALLLCFLEIVMKFLFSFFGLLGLLFIGLAFLGALFMFPPVDCLLLLVGGFCFAFSSMLALESL